MLKNSNQRTVRRWVFRIILHFWGMGKFNHLAVDSLDRTGVQTGWLAVAWTKAVAGDRYVVDTGAATDTAR